LMDAFICKLTTGRANSAITLLSADNRLCGLTIAGAAMMRKTGCDASKEKYCVLASFIRPCRPAAQLHR
jgi:hypothetical protein